MKVVKANPAQLVSQNYGITVCDFLPASSLILLVGKQQGTLQMMTMGCDDYHNCELVAKHPTHDHRSMGMLQWPQLQGTVIVSPIQQHHNFKWLLND